MCKMDKIMMSVISLLIFSSAIIAITASPFELTKEYIEKYENGMHEIIKAAKEFVPREYSFETLFKDKEVLKHPHEFDFVIVGAGTSGAVLASRLTEIPEYKVLLIEAGPNETPITKIPAMHPHVAALHQWGYKTVPQDNWCFSEDNHQCHVPTAKMIGGTTSVNEMLYNRGNKRDFDTWADEENKEWCYDDVLPYFKKSENAHLLHFDRNFHSSGGPQSVEDNDIHHNITKKFLQAGEKLHHNIVDYNGKDQLGFSSLQLMTMHGERRSAFASFIENIRRKNLYVLKGNVVVEIIISPHTKEAQGVKYIDPSGKVKIVKATKEVILSAGALNTAQLLMLSGVGPEKNLKDLDIECLVDSPVGKHLKDHPHVDMYFTPPLVHTHEEKEGKAKRDVKEAVADDPETKEKNTEQSQSDEDLVQYLKNSKGVFTQPRIKALAQIKTPSSKLAPKYPDISLYLRQNNPHAEEIIITVSLNHPKSEGQVILASKDQLKFPLINPNFYSDDEQVDFKTMKEGLAAARVVAHEMGYEEVENPVCSKKDKTEIDECIVKHQTGLSGDYVGTTRMGNDDKDSVVDNVLQVHGVHKLRVVDVSVVPVTITGNVRATGIMIAEKAADLIKKTWI